MPGTQSRSVAPSRSTRHFFTCTNSPMAMKYITRSVVRLSRLDCLLHQQLPKIIKSDRRPGKDHLVTSATMTLWMATSQRERADRKDPDCVSLRVFTGEVSWFVVLKLGKASYYEAIRGYRAAKRVVRIFSGKVQGADHACVEYVVTRILTG